MASMNWCSEDVPAPHIYDTGNSLRKWKVTVAIATYSAVALLSFIASVVEAYWAHRKLKDLLSLLQSQLDELKEYEEQELLHANVWDPPGNLKCMAERKSKSSDVIHRPVHLYPYITFMSLPCCQYSHKFTLSICSYLFQLTTSS